jgi:hypothetical protein
MANLIPYTKSSIIKRQKSAIIKADKFLNTKTKSSTIEPQKSAIVKADKFLNVKSTKVNENSVKPKQSENSSEDIILQIEKKVIKIDKLLKDSFALKKKQQKKSTIKGEQKEFEDREKELEKKKPKKEKGVNLPTPPKMGFIDWIKNFVFNTILGFLAVRLIKFLPTLLKIYPVIIGAGEFLINVGGNLLNSLVSFVDWGYKAVDATSGFIKSIGGEGLSKVFDNFMGAIDNVLEFAVMAALVSSGGDESDSGGLGGKGGRKGFDSQGRRVGTKVQQRYERRFGKDKFVDRFGTKNLKNVAQGAGRGGLQQGARNAFVGVAGKGGAKSILKFVRPLTNKLPIIGGLLNFGLSVALGEDPGRAAFKAIGSTLVGALGAAIGSLAFGVGGIIGGIIGGIGGDALGGALYDMFFKGKKPTQKQGKTNKLAGGGRPIPTARGRKPVTRTLKKKKSTRTLTFTPRKIQPGRSTGGEAKVQSVFPNPEKAWWDPLGVFTGKKQEQQPQQKKPKGKSANPQEFLIKSNDIFGRVTGKSGKAISGFATYIIKSLLGDKPDDLDYLNIAKGLNSFMQGIFEPGTLGFSGGGKVDARQFFEGKDYTKVIAKSVKESGSKEVDTIIRNLKNEMSLRPVGRDEMLQENIRRGTEGDSEFGGGFDEAGIDSGEMDLFTRMVYAEAGGEGKTGMSLVARAILNRAGLIQSGKVRAGTFNSNSGSISDVIKAPKQFSPMTDGRIKQRLTDSQINQSKDAIKLAQNPTELMKVLKSEGFDESTIKKLIAVTGFRNKSVARYDASQDVNEVNYKRHTFNTAGNTSLIVPKSVAVSTATIPGSVNLRGGDGKFIQGNSGRSGGTHFHIGTNKPGDGSGVATAGFNVIKHFLGKKSIHVGRSWEDIPSKATDEQIRGYIARGQAAHRQTELDLQIGGLGAGNKVAFPLALKGIKYSATDGYGVSADIAGTNAFVGHGRYKPDGSLAPQQKLVLNSGAPDFYAFHGMNKVMSKDGLLKFHKGEYISVTDADSFRLVGNILTDINSIENKSQLIAKAPSIIEKLKSISGYTDYENPNQEPQYIVIKSPPEIVYVPTGSGGKNVFIGGGVNNNMVSFDIEQKLSLMG